MGGGDTGLLDLWQEREAARINRREKLVSLQRRTDLLPAGSTGLQSAVHYVQCAVYYV